MPEHFLSVLPFDFSRPESQELLALLSNNIFYPRDIVGLLQSAAVRLANLHLEQPAKGLWHDALAQARSQGKLLSLLDAVCRDADHSELAPRIREFVADRPVLEARHDGRDLREGGWRERQERVIGPVGSLLDVAFLAKGASCARAVVRITAGFCSVLQHGTGFLIAPDLVLTNHHVLFDEEHRRADAAHIWFGYELDATPEYQEVAGLTETIDGEAAHDWAVVRLESPASADVPVLSLSPRRPVRVGARVSIIQHPQGGVKKIALAHNDVRFVDDEVVQYLTDTDHGSSGAPVFNERWEVVALHHMWTEAPVAAGKVEIRNQGIRIEQVAKQLRERGLLP